MCVVIDTQLFSAVTEPNNSKHDDMAPVIDWVRNGKGKIVHGGTKYAKEIKKHGKFLRLLTELSKVSKVVNIHTKDVDNTQDYLETLIQKTNTFDDHHVVAVLIVSGCILVCSEDDGFNKLLRKCFEKSTLAKIKKVCPYNGNNTRPKIYKKKNQASNLLVDSNISNCCK